jgi:capsular exopolysaccharide synthesis family protein
MQPGRPTPAPVPAPYESASYPPTLHPYTGASAFEAAQPNESRLLLEYLAVLGRNKGVLFLLAAIGLATGITIAKLQTPVFRATASMEIQGVNGDYLNIKAFDPTTAFQDYSPEGQILTQARIMQSEALLELVTARLKSSASRAHPLPAAALAYVTGHLDVRLVPGTHIVELLCDSTDKQLAADFANAWAQEYVDETKESRMQTTQQTETLLRAQLGEVKVRLQKAEEDLLSYARASNLMFTGEDQGSVAEEKLRQTQLALSETEKERIAKQPAYELMSGSPRESLPEFVDDAALRDDQSKLNDMRSQLAELRTYMAPGHAKIVRLEAQIAELDSTFRKELAHMAKRIANDYEALRRRENLLRSSYELQAKVVSEQAQKTIRYNILKRDVETNRTLYESLLQKVKEAEVAKAMRANNVRLVDTARTPQLPYKPRVLPTAIMGLMAGLFLGLAFVTVGERADHKIRAPGETPVCLKVPELGAIPTVESGASLLPLLIAEDGRESKMLPAWSGGPLPAAQPGSSVLAQSFRSTLASLLFSPENDGRCRGIVFTSAGQGDGKSTVISNLGLAMAETNRRVLLIDADLRSPRLHGIFGISNRDGLTELLRMDEPEREFVAGHLLRVSPGSSLYVLPAGSTAENISNLLYSARLPKLLHQLRQEFDAILIDSPAMLDAPDARILGRVAGAVVLVIRAGHTSRDTAVAARQRLAEDHTPLIGTILNEWGIKGAAESAHRKSYTRNGRAARNGNSNA